MVEKILVPKSLQNEVLNWLHVSHSGSEKNEKKSSNAFLLGLHKQRHRQLRSPVQNMPEELLCFAETTIDSP